MSSKILIVLFVLIIAVAKGDDAVSAAVSSAAASQTAGLPPPVSPPVPGPDPPVGGIGGYPGGFGGLGGIFPGFGGGFQKNIDFSASKGFGPFLGGLGGLGGVPPPVPVDGVDPGIGIGGYPGLGGLLGPSYIPSTWLGSALGAKGDLLFPLVIFVFFIVGVWTIVQFLLGLIVPLIASKVAVLKGVHKRDLSPDDEKQEQVNHLTNAVWAAFENFGCMKTSACYTGNIIHSLAGADKVKQYEGTIEALKIMDPEIVSIFKLAVQSGKEDCSKYPCHNDNQAPGQNRGEPGAP